jgi:hypothetical protein
MLESGVFAASEKNFVLLVGRGRLALQDKSSMCHFMTREAVQDVLESFM